MVEILGSLCSTVTLSIELCMYIIKYVETEDDTDSISVKSTLKPSRTRL